MRAALLLLPLFISACVVTPRMPGAVTVRHFASTETAGNGARWHIFLFDPASPRDLDTRIALARRNLQPGCRWADRPRAEIEARTAAQGSRYAGSVLAAPLVCRA